ncbi:MAG TPA: glutamate-5-semialdehyde dehydrogenase [Candidatus Deferrimicrobium sp.]|nr:glutamate-5-semialdehyde dehydrogenase [Candidatus Deferrimicrobium sp.]
MNIELVQKGKAAREAARVLASLSTREKNLALEQMAVAIMEHEQEILSANQRDVDRARENGLKPSLVNRLSLDRVTLTEMSQGLKDLISLPDPIGEVVSGWTRPNGLKLEQVRVPLGVIGIIYEARPNVTVDAAGLCLKSGNSVILRGGSEAIESNLALARVLQSALERVGLPGEAIQIIENTAREVVNDMLKCKEFLDVLIPRGGENLIRLVVENATVPVIETGTGNCHVFIDRDADLAKGVEIVVNSKTQRPGVCNAMETLLVDQCIAKEFLPQVSKALIEKQVELRGCKDAVEIVPSMVDASEADWCTEYLDLILAVKVVSGIDEAMEHIYRYGTKHSEVIVTENYSKARKFQQEVDAAAVYVNASTRFTDGSRFGFGAEIGISTQKLHARGPMGLKELTTIKYLIMGDGQIVS